MKTTANPKLAKATERTGVVPDTVIAVLSGTSVTGRTLRRGSPLLAPRTSSAAVNTAMSRLGATSIQPLFSRLSSGTARALSVAARQRIGSDALNLGNVVIVHVSKGSAASAAARLAGTAGISFADPDQYVETMNTGGQALTSGKAPAPLEAATATAPRSTGT